MQSLIIPPINTKGVFVFKAPFNDKVHDNQEYTVTSVRSLLELHNSEERPYETIYVPVGMSEAEFKEDLDNEVPIVVFTTNGNEYFYVPADRILSMPIITGTKYQEKILAISLGLVPLEMDMNLLKDTVLEVVYDVTGISSTAEVVPSSAVILVDKIQDETFRRLLENRSSIKHGLLTRLKQLQLRYDDLEKYVDELTLCAVSGCDGDSLPSDDYPYVEIDSGNAVGIFYGGAESGYDVPSGIVTVINDNGNMLGVEYFIDYETYYAGGASSGIYGVFFGGFEPDEPVYARTSRVRAFDSYGIMVHSYITAGTGRVALAGAKANDVAVMYGGAFATYLNNVTRFVNDATMVGAETFVGLPRSVLAGASVSSNALFYGGYSAGGDTSNRVTRVNSLGMMVGNESSVEPEMVNHAGCEVSDVGIFLGMSESGLSSEVVRIKGDGVLASKNAFITPGRMNLGAAGVGTVAIFYGGDAYVESGGDYDIVKNNRCIRMKGNGTILGLETNIGTARSNLSGCGIRLSSFVDPS